MVKKGEISFVILVASLIIIMVPFVSGQACTPATKSFCSGMAITPITTTGYGAVELCQECHLCGASDGVCPEDFADGTIETDENKSSVLLRVGNDRPTILCGLDLNCISESRFVINKTGDVGCATINGTCSKLQNKSTWDGVWSTSPFLTCSTDISGRNDYVRAVCSAPKTAGCQYCPDPDCTAEVVGVTFDNTTNQTMSAHVNAVSVNNPTLRSEGVSNGHYSMQSPRGNVRVICTAEDYSVSVNDVFLQRGTNIVDCRMNEAACTPECTLPDINGNPVCASRCDTQNTCNYASPETRAICDGVPLGAEIVINRTNATHVTILPCCDGDFVQVFRPLPGGDNSHIPNLLTRDYRKILNGVPVSLRIITYSLE